MAYTDPTPESLVVTLKAVLHNPTMYTPSLDSFNATLHLVNNGSYSDVGVVTLPMPNIHVLKPTSIATVDQKTAQILNSTELAKFATDVMTLENVTTRLVGQTNLHLGKLPASTVKYNSSTTYKGLSLGRDPQVRANGMQVSTVSKASTALVSKSTSPPPSEHPISTAMHTSPTRPSSPSPWAT